MIKNKQASRSNLIAIDIGSHSVKIAGGQRNGNKLKVSVLAKEQLPEGVFSGGRVQDPLALKSVIQGMIKSNHIKIKDAVVTFESQDIIKREMVVQKVDENDQMELVTYEVSQYLPIDIDAYVLQFKVIDEVEENSGVKLKILLGAMPKEIVKSLFDIIHECGLNPLYMDMHSNSMEKFLEYDFDSISSNKTLAFVDFGHEIIDISIYEKGVFKFNRLLKMGAGEFDKVLVDNLKITKLEAENRKKKTSVMGLKTASLKDDLDENDVKAIVINDTNHYIDECVSEINKVFKYYTSRNVDNAIDKIYVHGGGAQFKDLAAFFTDKFEIATEIISRFNAIEIATKNPVEELPVFINAVGALIRN